MCEQGAGHRLDPGYAKLYRSFSSRAKDRVTVINEAFQNNSGYVQTIDIPVAAVLDEDDLEDEWDALLERAEAIVKRLLVDVTLQQSAAIDGTNLRFMTIEDDELPWNRRSEQDAGRLRMTEDRMP